MNPSTAEIVEAIDATPAAEALVLPNNSNVLLAAEHAAALATKPVRVVATRSVQAGLAAIARYFPTNTPEQNESDMLDALPRFAPARSRSPRAMPSSTASRSAKGAWLGSLRTQPCVRREPPGGRARGRRRVLAAARLPQDPRRARARRRGGAPRRA